MDSDSPSKFIHSSGFFLLQASFVKKHHTSAAPQPQTQRGQKLKLI
jgi:hypothetical protein